MDLKRYKERVMKEVDAYLQALARFKDECIYCQRQSAQDIAREVKWALEEECYEGDAASPVDMSIIRTFNAACSITFLTI